MMNRFHWSMLGIGIIAFAWWTFFANTKNPSRDVDLYPQEHFLEDVGKIYCDIGRAAVKRGDLSKAIRSYQETIAMRPAWLEGYDRLGTTYELNNQPAEAVKIYAQAMALDPDFLDYRTRMGNKTSGRARAAIPSGSVEWTGQDLTGKKIFVYAEKGLSETLMFCRFLPLLQSKAAKVYFKPQEPLFNLLKQSKLGVTLCNNYTNLVDLEADYHVSLLSLQHYLAVPLEQLNPHAAYLRANPEKVQLFRKTFFTGNDIKVGIAWRPNVTRPGMKENEVPLTLFSSLCATPSAKIYLLQKSTNLPHPFNSKAVNLQDEVKDITDMAAIIENLDVLITADMTLATLGGALNKKTWLLTPLQSDWRWLNHWEKNHTVWFDHFKKFPQAPNKSWQQTMPLVEDKLHRLVSKRKATTTKG